MNKIFWIVCMLIIVPLSAAAQNGKQIYSINGQQVSPIENMIEPIGKDCQKTEFKPYQPSQYVSVGNTRYEIKVATDIYEEESTGFHLITIYKGTNKVLELKDFDMWTYMFNGKTGTNYRQYTDNRYFITLDLKDNIKALYFVGWPYGGDLPLLTIIVFTEEEVKVVFNKHMYIKEITKNGNEYSMKIQTNLPEEQYDSSGTLVPGTPEFITMYSEDGVLYIK